jgi:hypothetical protein
MKKGLLLLLAGFMAFGVAAKSMASARIDSMGADVRQIEDIDLIWLYPNKVLDYKNTVDFRLINSDPFIGGQGNGTDEWGGVIAEESSLGGVIGAYVNRPNRKYSFAHSLISGLDDSRDPLRYHWTDVANDYEHDGVNNIVDLFWAGDISGANLGVHVNYANNGIVSNGNWEEAQIALNLGLGFQSVGPFSQLNIHAGYGFMSTTEKGTPTLNKDNGTSSIKLGALAQAELSDTNSLRIFADASINQDNMTDLDNFNLSSFAVVAGVSCGHKVNGGKGLVSTGFIIDYIGSNLSGSYIENSYAVLWNASMETEVANWLTLRAGLAKALMSRVYDSDNGFTWFDNSNDNAAFNVGFGINWQNFVLDGYVDASSLEDSINDPQPGRGLFFGGNIVTVSGADLKFKF